MPALRALLPADRIVAVRGSLDVAVRRVTTDSRDVQPGDVFVCLPGYRSEGGETRADRHEFVPAALAAGASALVVEREVSAPPEVAVVRVADAWAAVADMAAALHGHPSRALTMIGVTGTSGKTSTTYFVDAVLAAAGHRVARLGTIDYRLGDRTVPAAQTTPEAPLLQSLLRDAVDGGCTAAVMEVSSHALALRRVAAIDFDVAVFTNLSHDHLNFHPDMHHYRRAKGRLFEELSSGGKRGTAVVNVDDPHAAYIIEVNRGGLVTYGLTGDAAVRARDVHTTLAGVRFSADTPRGSIDVRLRHLGGYSVYNALAALAVGEAQGLPLDVIADGLAAAPPVPGRFELVDAGQDFVVAVDYAHKPDALARLVESARALRPRRLITVFGCGGDRDRAKRPVMGRIAAAGSDLTVITSDNPRSEDPAAIVAEIVAGARAVDRLGERTVVAVDRAAAIRLAIARAGRDDIVLIAGKGHEPYQLIAGVRHDFDDRLVALAALRERRGS
ncbi:UDP-N-acetylmuramoyl-L-alanyl-D-glutamate--2,6-diaminopimelate ligase [bacterium]|nr:UDP-N-acetylmuramoyl-L-alanyl-D-glutamate--2,6-diaminopimelate ligase [bacterium]